MDHFRIRTHITETTGAARGNGDENEGQNDTVIQGKPERPAGRIRSYSPCLCRVIARDRHESIPDEWNGTRMEVRNPDRARGAERPFVINLC